MPPFDIEGGLGFAFVRGISVAACLSVLGALVFRLVVAPPVLAGMKPSAAAEQDRRWLRLLWGSVAAALLGAGGWLGLESGAMAGATGIADRLAAVPLVVLNSRFGMVLVIRLGLLAAVPLAIGRSLRPPRLAIAAALAAAAAASQASLGHAASIGHGFEWLALSTTLHILAAAIWLGQLPPLWIFLADAPPAAAGLALRRFSRLGLTCVILLAATASAQGWGLVGGVAGFVGTAYGWTALAKLLLFGILLAIAAINRFTFMPRLASGVAATARRALCRSVLVEAILGLLVILAAGILTSLPPGMDAAQGLRWPYR